MRWRPFSFKSRICAPVVPACCLAQVHMQAKVQMQVQQGNAATEPEPKVLYP